MKAWQLQHTAQKAATGLRIAWRTDKWSDQEGQKNNCFVMEKKFPEQSHEKKSWHAILEISGKKSLSAPLAWGNYINVVSEDRRYKRCNSSRNTAFFVFHVTVRRNPSGRVWPQLSLAFRNFKITLTVQSGPYSPPPTQLLLSLKPAPISILLNKQWASLNSMNLNVIFYKTCLLINSKRFCFFPHET